MFSEYGCYGVTSVDQQGDQHELITGDTKQLLSRLHSQNRIDDFHHILMRITTTNARWSVGQSIFTAEIKHIVNNQSSHYCYCIHSAWLFTSH